MVAQAISGERKRDSLPWSFSGVAIRFALRQPCNKSHNHEHHRPNDEGANTTSEQESWCTFTSATEASRKVFTGIVIAQSDILTGVLLPMVDEFSVFIWLIAGKMYSERYDLHDNSN